MRHRVSACQQPISFLYRPYRGNANDAAHYKRPSSNMAFASRAAATEWHILPAKIPTVRGPNQSTTVGRASSSSRYGRTVRIVNIEPMCTAVSIPGKKVFGRAKKFFYFAHRWIFDHPLVEHTLVTWGNFWHIARVCMMDRVHDIAHHVVGGVRIRINTQEWTI